MLYHPEYGYYTNERFKIGTQGDFFTSSSLGPDFGELLAEQFVEIWEILGYPAPFTLLEMGAGSGYLAEDIIDYLAARYPRCAEVLDYRIIEQSQRLIEQQKTLLKPYMEQGVRVTWNTLEEIADNSLTGCLFSNELLDAFPIHRVVLNNHQLAEVYVTHKAANLLEAIDELSTEKIRDYFNLINVNLNEDYPQGYKTEVNLLALSWLNTLAQKLKSGYIITIDYGYNAEKYYHPQRYQGTLKCYYQHHHHDNPYINIGDQDITSHVNFTALAIQGELSGLTTLGMTKQGLFLMALGLGERLCALSTSELSVLEVIKRRDALHQLIEPMGIGGFNVLIQTKGLTASQQGRSLKGLTGQL